MKPMIDDNICDCCAHLGSKDYADISCPDCSGEGVVPKKIAARRSLFNKLLRTKNTRSPNE